MNLVIISGSPRKESATVRVAQHLQKHFKAVSDHQVNLIDMRIHDIGMIQNVWSKIEDAPTAHRELAKTVFEADAFILVTPEYNGSYSPALKNLLDHFPKQNHKAFGIVTASPGMMGGMRASQQMQQMICAFFGIPSPHMLIVGDLNSKFDENANLLDASFQKAIDGFTKEFLWLAEKLVA